jgi:hypothetical protein
MLLSVKVAVLGSRSVRSLAVVASAIQQSGFPVSQVLSGGARGVDSMAVAWAQQRGIPFRVFPAQWQFFGRSAGVIRSRELLRHSQAVVLVWSGCRRCSPGSWHELSEAQRIGLPVFEVRVGCACPSAPVPAAVGPVSAQLSLI